MIRLLKEKVRNAIASPRDASAGWIEGLGRESEFRD
jgi:hypothetical protein